MGEPQTKMFSKTWDDVYAQGDKKIAAWGLRDSCKELKI